MTPNFKNILRILIIPALITTLVTHSMEIMSLKNPSDEEACWVDNRLWVHNKQFTALVNYERTKALLKENSISKITPSIEAKLYIDHRKFTTRYFDAHSNYCKFMKNAGIPLPQGKQTISMIPVIVIDTNDGIHWAHEIPYAIQNYEHTQALLNTDATFKKRELIRSISKKRFPDSLPTDLLCEHKTGDIIELTIHGYPTRLICSDNPQCDLPFKDHFWFSLKLPFDGILLDKIDSHGFYCLLDTKSILELLENSEDET